MTTNRSDEVPRWTTATVTRNPRNGPILYLVLSGLLAGGVSCARLAPAAAASAGPVVVGENPELSAGRDRFPDADAIILRWDQSWTLDTDGTVHRRDHQWMKLLNSRPVREYGDPRIDFHREQDELTIHAARTILPDGGILEVPDYSFNDAAPGDVGGWPEYLGWTQRVVSFSGIRDDAVLELEYEVTTRPGVLPWIEADLRLHEDYPTLQRVVTVTVPESTALHYRVDRIEPAPTIEPVTTGGAATYVWAFADLPGMPGEPHSLPWQRRCGRLRFTTCPSAAEWVAAILRPVSDAIQADESVETFVKAAAEDEPDTAERARKVAGKLKDSFNFISSSKALRGLSCRAAPDVLRANYGNPLESAALLAAALRALDLDVAIHVAVDATQWDEDVPTVSAFDGVVVTAEAADHTLHVHPQQGVFANPGTGGRRWLLRAERAGSLEKTYVAARGEEEPSELEITGKIKIGEDGTAAGDLRIRLSGAFYDPSALETSEKQKAQVEKLVGRVLDGFEVKSHSVGTLSDEVLRATAEVASKEALKKYGGWHTVRLGDGPAFLADFPLPLDRSTRRTDVHLDGRLRENVDLVIEMPEEWSAPIVPVCPEEAKAEWGHVTQTAEREGQTVRFRRSIAIDKETIPAESFAGLRNAINAIRADASLLLAFGKSTTVTASAPNVTPEPVGSAEVREP